MWPQTIHTSTQHWTDNNNYRTGHSSLKFSRSKSLLALLSTGTTEVMGGWFSFSSPPLIEEWRKIPWGHKERDLQYVEDYQPHNEELRQLRILLYGPAGSGKSSFVNSVDSLLQGRITRQALVDATSGDSFTAEYRTFNIQKGGPGTFYPFAFTDIVGLQNGTNRGVGVEDIKQAMRGHVKDGYNFNPLSTISEDDHSYNKTPTLNDKVHVLVCVVSANTVNLLSPETAKKMRDVRLKARDMDIPQLAILTKIDDACLDVKRDIKNVYMSKSLKKKMEELSTLLCIPLNCIFPVKNYHSEIYTDDDIDTLILNALRPMIDSGEDLVNRL
ncbi:interferon-induced protein 44-like isoform X1 [Dicentrarchus labrax]|uniref:interferon-induced protein 44-like isoform X1 n=1 Tax=Dicentrarchus labrax TaxID=13489 RepID=UPI0021F68171|nr:interferon-induced protein 44-like isoform X1 [Dicentrarchus labrax]